MIKLMTRLQPVNIPTLWGPIVGSGLMVTVKLIKPSLTPVRVIKKLPTFRRIGQRLMVIPRVLFAVTLGVGLVVL